MRKSKLAGFIIDCQTTDLDRAAAVLAVTYPTSRFCVVRATFKDVDATASEWRWVLFCYQLATHLTYCGRF